MKTSKNIWINKSTIKTKICLPSQKQQSVESVTSLPYKNLKHREDRVLRTSLYNIWSVNIMCVCKIQHLSLPFLGYSFILTYSLLYLSFVYGLLFSHIYFPSSSSDFPQFIDSSLIKARARIHFEFSFVAFINLQLLELNGNLITS